MLAGKLLNGTIIENISTVFTITEF